MNCIGNGKKTDRKLRKRLQDSCEDTTLIFWDKMDDAIVGLVSPSIACPRAKVVYSEELCIANLMRTGMTEEGAWEWYTTNVIDSYVGDATPIFVRNPLVE